MKKIINVNKNNWLRLSQRPTIRQKDLNKLVNKIFVEVKKDGDEALKKYSILFDKAELNSFAVSNNIIKNASKNISKNLKEAIQLAKKNIEIFHVSQKEKIKIIETTKGVNCWRENRAIEKIGIYIPGGTAPLFSTVLMLGIPAKLAGCKEIILCTPPNKNGEINPAILYTADLVGITSINKIGGIQAIAAMTFGTETIPKVFKIFGPGNQFVTAAKQLAQNFGVAIDLPAGPSEILIIADKTCNPTFVAADLLSQAEHGEDSQVILLSDDEIIIDNILFELNKQIKYLPRKTIAQKSLNKSKTIVFKNIKECIEFSNFYAPEHLIISYEESEIY